MRRLLPTLVVFAACGPIEPEPPTDADGNPIEAPAAYDDWLEVASVSPNGGDVGLRPTIRIQLDAYVEDDRLLDFAAVALQSGGLRHTGRVEWEMSTRTLIFRPLSDLVPDLQYTLTFAPNYLHSVTGAPFRATETPKFVATEDGPGATDPDVTATWEVVDGILERKCRTCHADPAWQLNPLTRSSLIGRRASQVDQYLVLAYDPGDSYLMHKVLPDYPVRRFTVQPPPWSDAQPLRGAEIRAIESWIRNGAR